MITRIENTLNKKKKRNHRSNLILNIFLMREKKVFFVECPMINVERITEIENCHFRTTIADSGKNYQ